MYQIKVLHKGTVCAGKHFQSVSVCTGIPSIRFGVCTLTGRDGSCVYVCVWWGRRQRWWRGVPVLVELMKEPGGDQRRENEMAFDLVGWLASDSSNSSSSRPQKCKVVWEHVRVECVCVCMGRGWRGRRWASLFRMGGGVVGGS